MAKYKIEWVGGLRGSFKYIDDIRKGMIFKYYTDEEIKKLIIGKEMLYFNTKQNGEREVILRKS